MSLNWLMVLGVGCSPTIGHAQPAVADDQTGSDSVVHVSTNTNGLWTGVREEAHGELHGTSAEIGLGPPSCLGNRRWSKKTPAQGKSS